MKKGICASEGIAIGRAYFVDKPKPRVKKVKIKDTIKEINRFNKALSVTGKEIRKIIGNSKVDNNNLAIFDAYLLFLSDPEFILKVENLITKDKVNAEYVVIEVGYKFVDDLSLVENSYLKERIVDIEDFLNRLIYNLQEKPYQDISNISEDVIILADELTPSLIVRLDTKYLKGIISKKGGLISHSVMLAKSLGIPTLIDYHEVCKISENDLIILDCFNQSIFINPDEEIVEKYREKVENFLIEKQMYLEKAQKNVVTKDGKKVNLYANISSVQDLSNFNHDIYKGIGLFRTDYMYIDRDNSPSEETQFMVYKKVLTSFKDKEVTIRLLDVDVDKNLPSNDKSLCGVDFLLENIDILKTQLRALLRASVYGNLKIIVPMIKHQDEFKIIKKIYDEVKKSLIENNVLVNINISLGMMIETVESTHNTKSFIDADFFSIGTNNLIKFIFNIDKSSNTFYNKYYDPLLLRTLNRVITYANEINKPVYLCGEMASYEGTIPLLLALGLKNLSIDINKSNNIINIIDKTELELILKDINSVLKMESNLEVKEYCDNL